MVAGGATDDDFIQSLPLLFSLFLRCRSTQLLRIVQKEVIEAPMEQEILFLCAINKVKPRMDASGSTGVNQRIDP